MKNKKNKKRAAKIVLGLTGVGLAALAYKYTNDSKKKSDEEQEIEDFHEINQEENNLNDESEVSIEEEHSLNY